MNKKLIGLAVASIFGILLLNITCEPPTEAPTTGTINGTILDATTSQPISGVMITTNPVTSSKTTDSEGNFLVKGVEPGIYTIQASKDGYKTNSTTVSVVAGEESSADIQLAPLEPELSVSATSLNFGTSSTNLTFTITNSGIGTLTWSIVSTANWITVNPTSGSTEKESDVVTVTVNRTGMSYGNHYETITVASNTNSKTFDIIMTVSNPNSPQLSAYPVTLDFETSETEMTFYITNTGTGMLTWNITDDKSWISYSPNSGTTETEIDEIKVTVDRLGLSPGNYTGNITVSSDGGNQNIVVSVTVPDEPSLSISPKTLDFGDTLTVLTFDVANAGTGDLNWSTSCNQAWITTSPTAGTNYGTVNVTASRDGISPGDYSGTVTVSSNGGTGYVEISMNVPEDELPTAVVLNSPTDVAFNSMKLTWTVNEDPDFYAYHIFRGSSPSVNENSTLVSTITNRYTLNYTDYGLTEENTYYYRIYVEDAIGQTTGSNVVNATTLTEPGTWGIQATINSNIDLYGIDVLNDNFACTVGDSGKVYFYNGSIWTEQQTMAIKRLYDVAVISQNDIYIVGEEGVIHYNGTIWNQPSGGAPTSTCYCIDYINSSEIWIGAENGSIWHYNGSNWIENVISDNKIVDIQIDNNRGWAISNYEFYYYNGVSWSLHTEGSTWHSVLAFDPSNIFLGAKYYGFPKIYLWNGSEWLDLQINNLWDYNVFSAVNDISGILPSDVWFILDSGIIVHWDGNTIQDIESSTNNDLNAIKMISAKDGWAVGAGGVILRYH